MKYCEALNLYRDLGNSHSMGICYNNIGGIHLKSNRYLQAIESYSQAVTMIEKERSIILEQQTKKNSQISEKEIYMNEHYCKYSKILANRVFQLAEAKLEKVLQEMKVEKQKKHLSDLDEIIDLYENAKETFKNVGGEVSFLRTITISIKVSFAFLMQNDIEKAEEKIGDAERLFRTLEMRELEKIDVPESVIKQKIYVQKGLIAKKKRKYREACEQFTLSLEKCELYDPKTKKE